LPEHEAIAVRVLGIDFTSAPRPGKGKAICCLSGVLEGEVLHAHCLEEWHNFDGFEKALTSAGPWIAGIDFPFGQSQTFIENIGWPRRWTEYVKHAHSLDREGFFEALQSYSDGRPIGAPRLHRRATDIKANSLSPQKLRFVPVGLMFFEGAFRLIDAGVTVPHLQLGDPDRIVVEAYPKLLAKKIIKLRSYKSDNRRKQTGDQCTARRDILDGILGDGCLTSYGLRVAIPTSLQTKVIQDPTGDGIDALMCAVQAAWAWTQRRSGFGAIDVNPLEGWIADPILRCPTA
jgi:hypothetical protein